MKKHALTSMAMALALLALPFADASGQIATDVPGNGSIGESGTRAGTSGAAHLLVPLTARYSALGQAATGGLPDMSGLEGLHANPSTLTAAEGTSVIFSRLDYVADIGVSYVGLAQQFGLNRIAFTVSAWDFGDIPLTTELEPDVSDVHFKAGAVTAGFSFARQLTDRIAVGTTVKVISETIDDVSGSSVAFDAGMNYTVGETGLRFGVAVKNIGQGMTHTGPGLNRTVKLSEQAAGADFVTSTIESSSAELPTLLNFGFSYTKDIGFGSAVNLLGNFRSNSFEDDQFGGGIEYATMECSSCVAATQLPKTWMPPSSPAPALVQA